LESWATVMYVANGNADGHFYIEPVRRPGLLPTLPGGNPMAPHQGTTERGGQGGQVVCMLMGFMNSRGQEVMCVRTIR